MLLIAWRIFFAFLSGVILTSPCVFMCIQICHIFNTNCSWELHPIIWGILTLVFIMGWLAGKHDRYLRNK